MPEQKTTHFGFTDVPLEKKQSMVADVFDSVAIKYDLMNDLMSAGVHRLWKRFTIEKSGVRRGGQVLDLAGGTGDLAALFSPIVGDSGQVVLADINDSMLKVGRDRMIDKGLIGNIKFAQVNAEALPFEDNQELAEIFRVFAHYQSNMLPNKGYNQIYYPEHPVEKTTWPNRHNDSHPTMSHAHLYLLNSAA